MKLPPMTDEEALALVRMTAGDALFAIIDELDPEQHAHFAIAMKYGFPNIRRGGSVSFDEAWAKAIGNASRYGKSEQDFFKSP